MIKALKSAMLASAFTLAAGAAHAACSTESAKADLTDEQAAELYACIEGELLTSYQKSGWDEANDFRNWFMPSTTPFISATHGKRFVNHYVNDIGKEAYLTYAEEDLIMPVGSITAKESYTVNKKGQVKKGPLFLMEKVAAGELPETGDWKYSVILPSGKVMGVTGGEKSKKVAFCHTCHEAVLDGQDGMFYPEEDYRVAAE
ncbi:MAG: cytochrome P460 family protein [Pseudomonadota bacterium]